MKTTGMVTSIKQVQTAVEAATQAVISYLETTSEPTAEEAHQIIDMVLTQYKCESPEGHIVAGGLQSAEPHEKGSGVLLKNTPIVIDIYPRSKNTGYYSDMTRTVCIGDPPQELQKMYDMVLFAQEHAIAMIKPGVRCVEIQKAVEDIFEKGGYLTSGTGTEFIFAEGFVHGLGHGVGLKIHKAPHIGRTTKDILKEGDVVTVEPGLYYKHIGGVRLEDIILVTASGAENLTNFPKKLRIA